MTDLGKNTLWHGRFGEPPSEALLAFTESLSFDRRLAFHDIVGSRAHVTILAKQNIVSGEERDSILAALDTVETEISEQTFEYFPTDEDIHTAIERRVTELAGTAGAKLHTGRSRNDQIATGMRLWWRDAGRELGVRIVALQEVLVSRAKDAGEVILPGYTHLQRAQPVMLAHHLLAHFWALDRDVDRLDDALARSDVSPLGAGALAGSSLPLDPHAAATALGFSRAFENSLDAVGDRDFVAEALFVLALTQVHLSRIGEEVVLWSSDEFGFIRLADAYSTGSSMLPQKKNPDIAELARAKSGRLIGNLAGFLATLKGLPLSYNRDLQEDKEPLFDAFDQCSRALVALSGLLDTATFMEERAEIAASAATLAATDIAEWLVSNGTPFREAHAIVGSVVRQAIERGVALEELVEIHPQLGPDAVAILAPGGSVARRTTAGGAGPVAVARQLLMADERLQLRRSRLSI